MAGIKYGRCSGDLSLTASTAARLVRLPLWVGLKPELDYVIQHIENILAEKRYRSTSQVTSDLCAE